MGTWYAIDPGYYDHVITLKERVKRRVNELGNVSYIVVYLDGGGFLELTHHYVPYDTIVIRVTYYGVPVVGARISLVHKFQGSSLFIPGGNRYFYTDANGTVVLHLGSPRYNREKVSNYDPYFLIYVNGMNTHYNVTSTGSYETRYIHIELTELN